MSTAALDGSPDRENGWIRSSGFDLVLLAGSPLVGLAIIGPHFASLGAVTSILGLTLAFAHYLATFAFFCWDENGDRHRRRWLAFFGGPALIIVAYSSIVGLRVPWIMQTVLFFWTVVHVSRQSCGILSIYRHRLGIRDAREKRATNAAVMCANLWLCLWNINSHDEVFALFRWLHPELPRVIFAVVGASAALTCGWLVLMLVRRARAGSLALPEILFLLASFAIFHPFTWLRSSSQATFAMLVPHYVQYLSLMWLVHQRRFGDAPSSGSARQRGLEWLVRRPWRAAIVLGGVGCFLVLMRFRLVAIQREEVFENFYLCLAFIHYYLDGLFWAFRDAHVRKTMGPLLLSV